MARTSSTCSRWPPRPGRIGIGIGICADNQFVATMGIMHELRADLILMPHAWPTPARAAGLVSQADVAAQQQQRMTDWTFALLGRLRSSRSRRLE